MITQVGWDKDLAVKTKKAAIMRLNNISSVNLQVTFSS